MWCCHIILSSTISIFLFLIFIAITKLVVRQNTCFNYNNQMNCKFLWKIFFTAFPAPNSTGNSAIVAQKSSQQDVAVQVGIIIFENYVATIKAMTNCTPIPLAQHSLANCMWELHGTYKIIQICCSHCFCRL